MISQNIISKIEAMLFAAGEAVETEKIAQILEIDESDANSSIEHLNAMYDERCSGICIVKMNNKFQLCTRIEHNAEIKRLLEIRRNTPLSQAAFEVLAVVAYNQPVTRSFVEQVRGVDSSGPMIGLVEKGLIEEKGRLDLPGRPLVYGTTDQFLRCFCLASLDELPDLPEKLSQKNDGQIDGQTSFNEFLQKEDNNEIDNAILESNDDIE